ncbi:MAG TPA: porin [Myxococcota bacterium]|nr:porin [Myxococcota bacterium]
MTVGLLLALLISQDADPAPAADTEHETPSENKEPPRGAIAVEVTWRDGFGFRSPSGDLQLLIGGRVHNDWMVSSADGALSQRARDLNDGDDFGSGTRFRRARINLQGQLYRRVGFRSEFEFAQGNQVESTDTYLEIEQLPIIGDLRIGNYKEPFSFAFLESSNIITFQEFSLAHAFSPDRNSGIGFSNTIGDRFHYATGVFIETAGFRETRIRGEVVSTSRVAAILFENKAERVLAQVGVSFRYERLGRNTQRYSVVSGSTLAPVVFDTGDLAGKETYALDGQLAFVAGPFDLVAEGTGVRAVLAGDRTPTYWGYFVSVGWFFTGESRPFNPSTMLFARVRPNKNLFDGGPGAFQLAARWSELDLNGGGRGNEVTGVLNWWANPHARISLAYVTTSLYGFGRMHMGQTRIAFDF